MLQPAADIFLISSGAFIVINVPCRVQLRFVCVPASTLLRVVLSGAFQSLNFQFQPTAFGAITASCSPCIGVCYWRVVVVCSGFRSCPFSRCGVEEYSNSIGAAAGIPELFSESFPSLRTFYLPLFCFA